MRVILLIIAVLLYSQSAVAQTEKPKKEKFSLKVLRDSTGALDMSDFLINYNGFLPVVSLITEPAFGNIGLMLNPLFIKPNKYQKKGKYTPPDITTGAVGYTANNTWFVGALRAASLPKHKLKYRLGLAYGDLNMDFYRTLPRIGETEFGFNFNVAGAFGSLLREVGSSNLYVGLQYYYAYNVVSLQSGENIPSFVSDKDLDATLSGLGLVAEFDNRDNVFTPDKGWYIDGKYSANANWTGSDYNFENLDMLILRFFQTTKKLVSGFKLGTSFQFGDSPFYLLPFINMRGVPAAKYQGGEVYELITEQRFDFTKRWSVLAFTGMAKAPTEKVNFKNSELVYNYGTGFRYLIASKFGLRTGVDVAWSNDNFGWYIVVGHAWNNLD